MDLLLLAKAALLGAVEGLTEFLPISSTGHLILASSLIRFDHHAAQVFEITIQAGAMLAVIWHYRPRLAATAFGLTSDPMRRKFALNLLLAFLPAAVFGLLFSSFIKGHLFNPTAVAIAFLLGGVVILVVEKRSQRQRVPGASRRSDIRTVDDLTPKDALRIGLVQCAALVPGTSRSGATIIGSMLLGLPRQVATEFSFYLGIPTLFAAAAYSMWQHHDALRAEDAPLFVTGTVVAFASALVCIRWLISYVSTHDFSPFGWYRIALGALILLTSSAGWISLPV
tara:strand:- start:2313 stop:3161 length:849 start_codon:yes stop_codon:yes gene_type:complete